MKSFFKFLFVLSIFLAFNFISCSDNATDPTEETAKIISQIKLVQLILMIWK